MAFKDLKFIMYYKYENLMDQGMILRFGYLYFILLPLGRPTRNRSWQVAKGRQRKNSVKFEEYTRVSDNEFKMGTEEFVNRNGSLSVYNGAYRTGLR